MEKFNINGRELYSYQISNNDLVKAIKDDNNACSERRNALMEVMLNRFEYNLCPKGGETEDDVFARFFSNFVNGKIRSHKRVAEKMGNDHRYLQNEMFKVCLEYIKLLAANYNKGYYDPRNSYACKMSDKMIFNLD